MPSTSLCAPPRATWKNTIGKLATQWAGKFTLVNRKTLEDLVILRKMGWKVSNVSVIMLIQKTHWPKRRSNSCSNAGRQIQSSTLLLPSETPYMTFDNLYAKCVHRSAHKHPHPNLLIRTADRSSVEITREKTSVRQNAAEHSADHHLWWGTFKMLLYLNK